MFPWESNTVPRTMRSVADDAFTSLVKEDMDASVWSEPQAKRALVWCFTRSGHIDTLPEYMQGASPPEGDFKECLSKALATCTSCNVPPRAFFMSVAETLGPYLRFRQLRLVPGMLCSADSTRRYDDWAMKLHERRRNIGTFSIFYVSTTPEYRAARDAVMAFFRSGDVTAIKPHDPRLIIHHTATLTAGVRPMPVPSSIYDYIAVRNRFLSRQEVPKKPVVRGRPVTLTPVEDGDTGHVGRVKPLSRWDPREDKVLREMLEEAARRESVHRERGDRMTARRNAMNAHNRK
jgi:hypothetical protein